MKNLKKCISILLIYTFSLISNISYSQLSGSYTVGSGGDYPTINSAVNDLNSLGVNAPVTFNILNGNFDESFTLNSFSGSSDVNIVTFRSNSGNPDDVILFTSSNSDYLVKVDGADNLVFMNLTFTDYQNSAPMKNRILFNGSCSNVKIITNKIAGGVTDAGIASFGAEMNGLEIGGNTFTLYRGIHMQEPGVYSVNTKIHDNNFVSNYGISLYRHNSMTIEKNVISLKPAFSGTAAYGIYIAGCNGDLRILKNIIAPNTNAFLFVMDGIKIDPFNGTSGIVANNMITIPAGTGMYIGDCVDLKIFYNTIKCYSSSSGDVALIYSTGVNLKNNIFVQLADFAASTLTYNVISSQIISNHNNFYFLSSYMLRYLEHGLISTFSEYKSLTGQDLNSVSKAVNFVSQNDLHLFGTSIGDEDLVGIPLAEVTDDIDGNPRDPVYPYMGADEGDVVLPIELASFTSQVSNSNVILNWTTTTEKNNSGFEIQRRGPENEWTIIGFAEGNGSSGTPKDYTFTDMNLNSGIYNYRLKQIDLNGEFKFYNLTNEVRIAVPENYSLSQNYPNPFNPVTQLKYGIPHQGFVSLKVYDMLGNEVRTLVNENKTAGSYSVTFDAANLSSGIYFYKLTAGDFSDVKKMTLVK